MTKNSDFKSSPQMPEAMQSAVNSNVTGHVHQGLWPSVVYVFDIFIQFG
jgi:hypothetical protein